MTKIERAIAALNECADAMDDIPESLRKTSGGFGQFIVVTSNLRTQAEHLQNLVDVTKEVE